MIELRYSLTVAEVSRVVRTKMLRLNLKRTIILFAAVLAIAAILAFGLDIPELGVLVLFLGAIYAAFVVAIYLSISSSVRKIPKLMPSLGDEILVRISDQQLETRTTIGEASVRRLYRIAQQKDALLLYVDPINYLIIPKRT